MFNKAPFFALILVLVSFEATAEGIAIEPGKWEMSTTMNMPMLSQPKVSTVTECMEESELSPEKMTDEMDSGCTFDARVVENNTMKWSMDCVADTGSSRGEWEATSHGDTLTGSGTITIDVQGQSMEMLMSWEGKRVGECD
jgi:hypothetical protein